MSEIKRELLKGKRVGIIGGNCPDSASLENAEKMGELIAQNGYALVNGGMGGVMEASARGARSKDGLVIAILPGKSVGDANSFVDIAIPTGLGYMRNALVILNSDIVVAIDGSYGTLSEIAYTKIYKKMIFGLNTWNIQGVVALPTPEEIIKQVNNYFKSK
ncbi:MAG: TIGR00725 family protein [Candidatus Aminicenantes bacterium]|nr:TIGR00725 family protein [Candidatus Aminicenantes bacterium]